MKFADIRPIDDVPHPPPGDPRAKLPLTKQKRFVGPGEFVDVRLIDLAEVQVIFPSKFSERYDFDIFNTYILPNHFGLVDPISKKLVTTILVNYKRVIYWPNERVSRYVMRTPEGGEIYC